MKMKILKVGQKPIAYISLFTNYKNYSIKSKHELIEHILSEIKFSKVGYAGFTSKNFLRKHLLFGIFGDSKLKVLPNFEVDEKVLMKVVESAVKKSNKLVASKPVYVFIFPCFDSFVKRKLCGVSGVCTWNYTFSLFINPVKGWQRKLEETVCHEYAHAISQYFVGKKFTLLQTLLAEGLAKHFREAAIGGKSMFATLLSTKQIGKILAKIKTKFQSKDTKLQNDLLFGGDDYPLWSGYAIGYFLVERYLERLTQQNWSKILKMFSKSSSKKLVQIFGLDKL